MYRVMFVDDEPRVLEALRRSLHWQTRVWDMQFMASALAALAQLRSCPVDVIVADFRMPGTNGGQLLRAVAQRWPATGRLLLSGHTDEDDLNEAVSVADRCLDKPCSRSTLVAAIEQSLWRGALDGAMVRAEAAVGATYRCQALAPRSTMPSPVPTCLSRGDCPAQLCRRS
jgi:DNA-binding NarL/FixJ family response regulator